MNRLKILVLVLAAAAVPAAATAQTLTFEGLADHAQIPAGYGGFTWSAYFNALDASTSAYALSGYRNGTKSGVMVGYTAWENLVSFGSATPFTFNSVWITPAWTNGQTVTIHGWNGANLLYTGSFVSSWTQPVFFAPNWSGVTLVDFVGTGGAEDPSNGGNGQHLAFDDLTVNQDVVPEPATMLLLATGLAGIGGAIRRRRQQN